MSNEIDILNSKGASVGKYALNDACLEYEKGTQAVHDVVIAYLAGERASTASTKTRGEVAGSGKKPFKQKGLGRARAGSVRSPIWRKGGITFGPSPERNYTKKINANVRKLALKRAFSEAFREGIVSVVEEFALPDHKTKNVKAFLDTVKAGTSVVLVVKEYDEKALKATMNMPEVLLIKAASLNVYQMLRFKKLIFTKDALDAFLQRFA